MKAIVAALILGMIFGLGLCVSQMVDPARVIGFLDVAGHWDATLVFVMAAAVMVAGVGFPLVTKRVKPVLADRFVVPTKIDIDPKLIIGGVIFGVGWGLGGLCPGAGIVALVSMSPSIVLFVAAMIGGQWLASAFER